MAVRFDASGDYFIRTSDLLDYNSNYTMMGWFLISVDQNAVSTFMSLRLSSNQGFDIIATSNNGTTFRVRVRQSSGNTTNADGSTLTVGTWYHIAVVRDGSASLKGYLDGVLDVTNTQNISGRGSVSEHGIGAHNATLPLDGKAFALKSWSTDLSVAQVKQEMFTVRPLLWANLHQFVPVLPGLRAKDYSGQARDFTENGTLTDEASPSLPWGNHSHRHRSVVAAAVEDRYRSLIGVGF